VSPVHMGHVEIKDNDVEMRVQPQYSVVGSGMSVLQIDILWTSRHRAGVFMC
jgi:hypothetical protein